MWFQLDGVLGTQRCHRLEFFIILKGGGKFCHTCHTLKLQANAHDSNKFILCQINRCCPHSLASYGKSNSEIIDDLFNGS